MSAGTPLVLLPGLLCDAALWRHQTDTLADIAEITVADLAGDDCLEDMARSVLETAPETFALAGLSMGGFVAQAVMRQAPDRVTRLALLDTSARADTPGQSERRRAFIAQTRHGDFKGVTSRLLPMLIHPGRLEDGDLTGTIMAMAEGVGREAFLRQQNAIMNRPDCRRDLSAIHCPTLILCGRQDALTPLAGHEEMAEGIPDSNLVVIEDCGHMAPLERPRAVSAVMRYWLND